MANVKVNLNHDLPYAILSDYLMHHYLPNQFVQYDSIQFFDIGILFDGFPPLRIIEY